jgi:hypothetical protein
MSAPCLGRGERERSHSLFILFQHQVKWAQSKRKRKTGGLKGRLCASFLEGTLSHLLLGSHPSLLGCQLQGPETSVLGRKSDYGILPMSCEYTAVMVLGMVVTQ